MLSDALLVAGKDLRIEIRSKVGLGQVAPFAAAVLLIFGFALGPDRKVLQPAAAGLFWVAVLLSALLAVQRSFAIETVDGGRDGLRLSGLDPAGIFVGKATAIGLELLVLEVLLGAGVAVLYGTPITGLPVLAASCIAGTIGVAAVGTVFGIASTGLNVKETLLPLLFLPVVAPVLLSATKAWQEALAGHPGSADAWLGLLAVFAVVYVAIGAVAFEPLLENG